jgi:phosphate transport system substrate-binding protein
MTAGSIVLAYNLEGVSQPLRLSRKAYLGIFLHRIRRWDHPDIKSANPGLDLPSTPITVVRRAEGSGTTYAFTNHLNAVGKAIGEKWTPGVSKASDNWPGRTVGGRGNDGVAALIQQIPGSIGYLEYGYAKLAELPAAVLENRSGAHVAPTPESSLAALTIPKDFKMPEQFRIWIPDPPGKDAYPIVTYTWLLCYKDYRNYSRDSRFAETLKKVLRYCLTEGQKVSAELGYIPLPREVAEPVLKAVEQIQP